MENEKKTTPPPSEVADKQIVVQENNIVKFDPDQDIKQGQKAAKALMKVVEITKPLKLNGKTYLYFEHWQTMAKFFRMTVGIEKTTKLENGYEAKSMVYQNGTIIGGAEASCLRDEVNWKGKPEFQLKSMAQTRAMAKALRSILGYIPVLAGIEATPAEEMNVNEMPKKVDIESADINEIVPGTPPVNLIGKNYERYAEKLVNAQSLRELEGYGQNIKFLGKTLTIEEKKKLRILFAKRKMELKSNEIIIEAGDLPK